MKRILFSVFVVMLVLSCSAKDYTLNGKIDDNSFDGVKINIRTYNGKEWIDSQSEIVNSKQFKLTGNAEKPEIAVLSYSDRVKELRGSKLFILENGKTDFTIDKEQNIRMKGTKSNNLLQTFEDDLDNMVPQGFKDSLKNNLYTQDEYNKRVTVIGGKQEKYIEEFAKKNVNTIVGTAIFLNSAGSMDINTKLDILALMNEETKQNPQIQSIAKQAEIEGRTAAGRPYTNFTLPDTNGDPFSLSQLIGKSDYVLIDFWASWCGPCLRSFPDLTAFYNENKGQKFEILGVSLDRDEQSWKNAIEKHGLLWKHVSDLKYWQSEAGKLYGVGSIPCTILIDKDGKIVGRNLSLSKIKELISKK